jgi:predicted dehydrogenase
MSMSRLIAGAMQGRAFEEPVQVLGCGNIGAGSRVDEAAIAAVKFPGGMMAQLACGVTFSTESTVRIWGDEGSLVVPTPWGVAPRGGFSKIVVFKGDIPEEVVIEADRGLYTYEADHVAEHIAARQSPAMSWDDSLGNARALDAWRAAVGMRYDFE